MESEHKRSARHLGHTSLCCPLDHPRHILKARVNVACVYVSCYTVATGKRLTTGWCKTARHKSQVDSFSIRAQPEVIYSSYHLETLNYNLLKSISFCYLKTGKRKLLLCYIKDFFFFTICIRLYDLRSCYTNLTFSWVRKMNRMMLGNNTEAENNSQRKRKQEGKAFTLVSGSLHHLPAPFYSNSSVRFFSPDSWKTTGAECGSVWV